jgi:acyl-CoA reductase-like NAD-dependent aldehyde dehydrogenase
VSEPLPETSERRAGVAEAPQADDLLSAVACQIAAAREAQAAWAARPINARLAPIREIRHRLAREAEALADTVTLPQRPSRAETIAAEILPLADACRFLQREAPRALAPRKVATRGRPFWLRSVELQVRREPWGVVLIISPGNYPLFLPGVHAFQALVAGNAVLLKPAPGSSTSAAALAQLCSAAGIDPQLIHVLPESPEAARAAIAAGVDKVVLTGSARTGQAVLADLAPQLTPATMELSGCDAVFVRHDADVELVVKALTFGLRFNGSATCIAPRRVFIHEALFDTIEERLARRAVDIPAVSLPNETLDLTRTLVRESLDRGARLIAGDLESSHVLKPLVVADATPDMRLMSADIFAPILSLTRVAGDEEAVAAAARCPYALGATVFGERRGAEALAGKVRAGCVVVNDAIVPTADPRLPFGGRGRSGFGVTRGVEGLLAMTSIKSIAVRRGRWLPHFEPDHPDDARLFADYLRMAHGGSWRERIASAVDLIRTALKRRRKVKRDAHGKVRQ